LNLATAPTEAEVAGARAALAAADPLMAKAHAAVAPCAWRVRPRGFVGLTTMVVEQQVSVAAAAAIWRRFEAGLGGAVTPAAVLAADETVLRGFGLSGQKARYVRAIAEVGDLFDQLHAMGDDEAVAHLMAIKGVGRWTAEAYLLFCEGRRDFLPAADIALQEAVRLLEGAESRLSEKALYQRAQAWSPHRGVASLLLWAYYTAVKKGEIVP
jgi:DNA-3-methyladenine glycosylase II